jgi:hypothetical protein
MTPIFFEIFDFSDIKANFDTGAPYRFRRNYVKPTLAFLASWRFNNEEPTAKTPSNRKKQQTRPEFRLQFIRQSNTPVNFPRFPWTKNLK